jgi:prepilin-type processing-associated H-X9-DG protein
VSVGKRGIRNANTWLADGHVKDSKRIGQIHSTVWRSITAVIGIIAPRRQANGLRSTSEHFLAALTGDRYRDSDKSSWR